MKRSIPRILRPALPTLAFLAGLFCWQAAPRPASAVPPLSLEGYLDEKLPDAAQQDRPIRVDNSACYVCHGNLDGEELVLTHAAFKIGCVLCHGESVDHRNDEDNAIAPDKMYALEDVNAMCGDCHEEHDAAARDVIQRWRQRCPGKTDPKEIVCTDCHFHHRLAFRTVWWDKKTGKLVVRKEGQRVKHAADHSKPAPDAPK